MAFEPEYSAPFLMLPEDGVDVWWAHARTRSAQLLSFLDPLEATRHSALRRPADRDRFASGHALLRIVLAGYRHSQFPDEVSIRAVCSQCGAEGHGKPALYDLHAAFTFSLTHAGARVGVAVARDPVGIDVEIVTDADDSTHADSLSPAESTWLARRPAADRPHAFTRTWTRKEALLKATGDGRAIAPSTLVVTRPDRPPALVSWPGGPDPAGVQLVDLAPGAGHVGALAVLTGAPLTVRELDGEPLLAEAAEPPSIA